MIEVEEPGSEWAQSFRQVVLRPGCASGCKGQDGSCAALAGKLVKRKKRWRRCPRIRNWFRSRLSSLFREGRQHPSNPTGRRNEKRQGADINAAKDRWKDYKQGKKMEKW